MKKKPTQNHACPPHERERSERARPRSGRASVFGGQHRGAYRAARRWGGALLVLLGAIPLGCRSAVDDFYSPVVAGCGTNPLGEGGTGGTGGAPPECIPSNSSLPVGDDCGVFVSSTNGDDANDGTKTAPKKTLAAAIAEAKGLPVYACNDGFSEALALAEDATIYGGLDCAQGWRYAGNETKTPWTASADAIPLRIATGARAKLEDVAITAADATVAGGSSIGVLAEVGTQLAMARCEVTAGDGANGADGEAPQGTGTAGVEGDNGVDACTADAAQVGGTGGQLTCDATNVAGGDGGNGTKTMTGGAGSPGAPLGAQGVAGIGQGLNIDCMTDGNGGAGAPGTSGLAGAGAPATLGTLGPSGVTGVAGMDGAPGLPGQGGGGGGGGRVCANGKAGPSGGGGGSGGCGGGGGKGGKAAGSSIALVSLGSKLTLDAVTLTAKSGGKGGAGGNGQPGGPGGNGGQPGTAEAEMNPATACTGGKGGDGGNGGEEAVASAATRSASRTRARRRTRAARRSRWARPATGAKEKATRARGPPGWRRRCRCFDGVR